MIAGPIGALIGIIGVCLCVAVAVLIVMYVMVPIFKGIIFVIAQLGRFVIGEVGDVFRIVGAVVTNVVFIPLVVGSVVLGRWSAAAHYGRAIQSEFKTMGLCVYRIAIGHPIRLLCLTPLTDGIERRLPEVVAAAPGPDRPSKGRAGQFDGYRIVGSLPGGGSGSRLYIAEPDELKQAVFTRTGQHDVGKVVIKVFSLRDGSSLPQIVREGRALDAAKRLGLVLEHELNDERFFYVTRYVPGESLGLVTQRLHAQSGGDGLAGGPLAAALSYTADLLRTLDTYHRGGLWHKDVKPDNIVVDGRAAHLVDFGLVTPLRSAMTLTTHGTEYFRDPEMVRMALKGVKVHQVDGAKFDLYATGAVLFSMIENSFPAHGGLSQVTKKCPEALRWIVRRAMAEYDRRYPSAAVMLADLETVRAAHDPFSVRPADLPSVRDADAPAPVVETVPHEPVIAAAAPAAAAFAATPMPAAPAAFAPPAAGAMPRARVRPSIKVAHWWSGRYESDSGPAAEGIHAGGGPDGGFAHARRGSPVPPAAPRVGRASRVPASQQLDSARARVAAARERARQRMAGRRPAGRSAYDPGVNAGVATALFAFLAAAVAVAGGIVFWGVNSRSGGPRLAIEGSSARVEVPLIAPDAPIAPEPVSSRRDGRFSTELKPVGSALLGEEPGRVLIINDIGVAAAERTILAISSACERLTAEGFELLGDFPGNDATGADRESQDAMEAAARATIGLTQLDAPDAAPTIEAWLRADDEADMIVWFKPSTFAAAGVEAFVFADLYDSREEPRGYRESLARRDVASRLIETR